MGNAFGLMFVIVALEFALGLAVLGRLRVQLSRPMTIALSVISGMFLHSLLLFLTQLVNIPISVGSIVLSALAGVVALHVPPRQLSSYYAGLFRSPRWTLSMYDVVTLAIGIYLLYISVWATFYWPVTPFDAMAGIDLVAKTAVQEGTLNCSIYRDPILAGHLSNQPFYAPFAMLQQVITRSIGFPFGQVWLSVLSISMYTFMFTFLRERVHPFIADVLWIFFIMIPELYGYTLLMQTDFANAVYYSIGGILMIMAIEQKKTSLLWASTLFLAGAAWSRSESFLLVGVMMLAMIPWLVKTWSTRQALTWMVATGSIVIAVFALWHVLWFRAYLPVRPDTAAELIGFDPARFLSVTGLMFANVLSDVGYWGMTFYGFIAIVAVDVAYTLWKKVSWNIVLPAMWILVTFVVLLVVGTIFASAVVDQTLRRGLFKILPFVYMFIAGTTVFQLASQRLQRWTTGGAR
jgi:hypothetical protein